MILFIRLNHCIDMMIIIWKLFICILIHQIIKDKCLTYFTTKMILFTWRISDMGNWLIAESSIAYLSKLKLNVTRTMMMTNFISIPVSFSFPAKPWTGTPMMKRKRRNPNLRRMYRKKKKNKRIKIRKISKMLQNPSTL